MNKNNYKDYTGNKNSAFKIIGAIGHSKNVREINDFYATDPHALELLLKKENFNKNILEPACGQGHLSKVLLTAGYNVISEDLIDRGYGTANKDFLIRTDKFNGDIITNPPYKFAQEFVEKALSIIDDGHKIAMFLKLTFLEGNKRKKLFQLNPPIRIYVASKRFECGKNGEFTGGSAIAYAWFIWEKGYHGKPSIDWIN